jgi:hypothetical protein
VTALTWILAAAVALGIVANKVTTGRFIRAARRQQRQNEL